MPYSSLRKCTFPGCNVLVKSGRCPAHSAKLVKRNPAVKKLYNSRQWQAMRAIQLSTEPWCRDCLSENAHTLATEVDHITPHLGDAQLFFDPTNLQSLCESHHSSKTAKEVWHA
jgi:5-methylcytosine-specific restriction protein A